jgi:hypothetical protein
VQLRQLPQGVGVPGLRLKALAFDVSSPSDSSTLPFSPDAGQSVSESSDRRSHNHKALEKRTCPDSHLAWRV